MDEVSATTVQANSEAQASKAQMEGLVQVVFPVCLLFGPSAIQLSHTRGEPVLGAQGQAGLLKKATESTTTMYHAGTLHLKNWHV